MPRCIADVPVLDECAGKVVEDDSRGNGNAAIKYRQSCQENVLQRQQSKLIIVKSLWSDKSVLLLLGI